jgi:hypothetical protein
MDPNSQKRVHSGYHGFTACLDFLVFVRRTELMMSPTLPQGVRTFCLIFGLLEGLGAGIWCLAGAGIYGSPLADMRGLELAHVWAFLILGPFSALFASILALWKPQRGGAWLFFGGIASGFLAVPFLATDAYILPLVLASLPMALVGRWLLRTANRATEFGEGAERPVEGQAQQFSSAGVGSILLGALLFLVAFIGTYGLFVVLALNNVTGLRGPPSDTYPVVYPNANQADGVVLLTLGAVTGLVSVFRKQLRLRVEAVAGMWLALLLGGLFILAR